MGKECFMIWVFLFLIRRHRRFLVSFSYKQTSQQVLIQCGSEFKNHKDTKVYNADQGKEAFT